MPIPAPCLRYLQAPPAEVFLNEGFPLTLTFSNTGDATGFGPVVELLVPPGVDASTGSAAFLGMPVSVIDVGTFGVSGLLTDPLTGLDVTGPEGYRLLIIEYPLGSFTTAQPAAVITMDCTLNSEAVLGIAETFLANPLFRFGADALDNPTTDPPPFGAQATCDVVPTVITLDKKNDAHEKETATGPNYPVTYTLTVDIANLADIEDLTVTDVLPGNLQFLDVVDNDGADNVTEPSTSTPGGSIVFEWYGTTTGILGPDLIVKYRVYAPEFDDEDDPVIDPDGGQSVPATNEAEASGDYDDGEDLTPVSAQAEETLTLRSIAIQKGVDTVTDVNADGTSPGDTLEYTIDFQISDYFAFEDIVITDVVGDGQTFLDSHTPHLSVTEGGASDDWDFADGDTYDWSHNPSTGETTLTFYVSQLLDAHDFGHNADGSLEGDIYHDDSWDHQPATGTITFRTTIDEAYEDPASYTGGDEWLDAGDSTGNSVVRGRRSHGHLHRGERFQLSGCHHRQAHSRQERVCHQRRHQPGRPPCAAGRHGDLLPANHHFGR